jgi:hypothetical protein
MATLKDIEHLTHHYANTRQVLTGRVQALQLQIDRLRAEHIKGIRAAVRDAADAHDKLRAAVEVEPALFSKPKTQTFHGVRVGYMKQRGKVVIENEAAVIGRIRKLLPKDQAELLVRVSESVHKPAVYDLVASDLKRLGIRIAADEDVVVIKPVDGEVDKLVSALLGEAEANAQEAAA